MQKRQDTGLLEELSGITGPSQRVSLRKQVQAELLVTLRACLALELQVAATPVTCVEETGRKWHS